MPPAKYGVGRRAATRAPPAATSKNVRHIVTKDQLIAAMLSLAGEGNLFNCWLTTAKILKSRAARTELNCKATLTEKSGNKSSNPAKVPIKTNQSRDVSRRKIAKTSSAVVAARPSSISKSCGGSCPGNLTARAGAPR